MEETKIFSEYFFYIATFIATLTTALAGLINGVFKVEKNWAKQLVAWLTGLALSFLAVAVKIVNIPNIVGIISLAIVVGLESNGIYDIKAVKELIKTIGGNKKENNVQN